MSVKHDEIMEWLLEGDPAIRWQTYRDLMQARPAVVKKERNQIPGEGWGAKLLSCRDANGLWAKGIYTPKWQSTTYSMLLLRRMGLPRNNGSVRETCRILLEKGFYDDGGINYFPSYTYSETCVTGMILSILCYFDYQDDRLEKITDHLLKQQMPDHGWNCQSYRGAVHSSFHTTISVLEGLREFEKQNSYRSEAVREAQEAGIEFLLQHKLFRSDTDNRIIDPQMTRFSFPPRWRYDVMRVLDYMQERGTPKDPRMDEALDLIKKKRRKDGTWPLQNRHPGKTFFEMETVGHPSRWNTLRALRILQWFN